MRLKLSSRIQAIKGHVSAEVQDETVVLHRSEGVYYGLNATGAVLWQALSEPRSISELAMLLHDRFNVTHEEAGNDVDRLVVELLDRQLVELLPD